MGSRTKQIVGFALVVAAVAGWCVFLYTQGLEDADRWSSVVGMILTTAIGLVGLALSRPIKSSTDSKELATGEQVTERRRQDPEPQGSTPRPEASPGSPTFHVKAQRDSYTANTMFVNNSTADGDPKPAKRRGEPK